MFGLPGRDLARAWELLPEPPQCALHSLNAGAPVRRRDPLQHVQEREGEALLVAHRQRAAEAGQAGGLAALLRLQPQHRGVHIHPLALGLDRDPPQRLLGRGPRALGVAPGVLPRHQTHPPV